MYHDVNMNVYSYTILQIHSVLIDRINPATTESDDISDFSGPALHSAYQSYMAILVKLRISALVTYHALMHRICMAVTWVPHYSTRAPV